MPRCPNCNYSLVLLEHRRKYKCAKCSGLFSQKEIDTLEFQKFNKLERQKDKEKVFGKLDKTRQLSLLRFTRKESQKAYREKNKDIISTKKAAHYEKNKERILTHQKEYRQKSGQAINERARLRRLNNIEEERQRTRIKFWRNEQKVLAVQMLENGLYSLYNQQFQGVLPTILLS